jgi:colanic acid biosynthesis protein WcaH
MFIPQEEYTRIQAVLPILCVDCIIVYEQKCLLLRRTKEPAKGQYWFPGGRVFKGETIQDAALRKAREEVNLDCRYEKFISVEETIFEKNQYMDGDIHTVNICSQLSIQESSDVKMDTSHDDFIWLGLNSFTLFDLHIAVSRPLRKCLKII